MEELAKKNILLVCTAGITTGLLVKNMQKSAEERGIGVVITSTSATLAEETLKEQKVDALMIGPQAKHEIARLDALLQAQAIPFQMIADEDYQILDGEAVLQASLDLLQN